MRIQPAWLCLSALACAACSDGTASTTQPMNGTPGGTTATAPNTPPAGTAGAHSSAAGAGSPATTATNPARAGATAPAPTATAGSTAPPAPAAAGSGGIGPITSTPIAGSGGVASPTGTAGSGAGPSGLASDPIIPEVSGDCPMFKTGSITVMGLGGISITAGAKKDGAPTGPLIFYWHGTGSVAGESSNFAGTQEVTQQGGVLVSFGSSKGSGGDCSGTGTFSLDDFKVADQITACAVKNHNIDPKRIYTTGCSAGGLMAGCMAIQRSKYVAVSAPNSGGVTIGYGTFQDPTRVANIITMHGAPGSDVVIVDFSQTSEGYDNYMLAKGAFVVNCNHGGGHCGAPAALQQSAWKFMKDHPFGTHPSPYAAGLPSDFNKSCKIFTATMRQPLGEGSKMMMP